MRTEQIILEAPEFGAGRECSDRPVDLQKIDEVAEQEAVSQSQILNQFSCELRQTMLILPTMKRAEQVAKLKEIGAQAGTYGARQLADAASKMARKPADAALMAKYVKSTVETVTFISSLSRI